jgi:hypothetical protein
VFPVLIAPLANSSCGPARLRVSIVLLASTRASLAMRCARTVLQASTATKALPYVRRAPLANSALLALGLALAALQVRRKVPQANRVVIFALPASSPTHARPLARHAQLVSIPIMVLELAVNAVPVDILLLALLRVLTVRKANSRDPSARVAARLALLASSLPLALPRALTVRWDTTSPLAQTNAPIVVLASLPVVLDLPPVPTAQPENTRTRMLTTNATHAQLASTAKLALATANSARLASTAPSKHLYASHAVLASLPSLRVW